MFLGVSGKWQVSTLKLCVNTVVLNVSKAPYGLFRANGRIPKDTNINYPIQCANNPHWTSYLNWFEKLKCTKALYKVYGKWNSKITILMQQKLSNSDIKFTTHISHELSEVSSYLLSWKKWAQILEKEHQIHIKQFSLLVIPETVQGCLCPTWKILGP